MTKKKDMIRIQKSMEEFKKLETLCKEKIKEMLESGLIIQADIDLDFYEGDQEVEVELAVVYPDGTTDKLTKSYIVEIQIQVRERHNTC